MLCLLFGLRVAFVYVNDAADTNQRVVLVGWSKLGCDLSREIRLRPELGINLVGYVDDNEPPQDPPFSLPRLGSTRDLEKIVMDSRIECRHRGRAGSPWTSSDGFAAEVAHRRNADSRSAYRVRANHRENSGGRFAPELADLLGRLPNARAHDGNPAQHLIRRRD